MTALAADRNTPQNGSTVDPALLSFGVAATTTIYQGSLVAIIGGYAKPATATATTGVVCVGRAEETVVNSGLADAKKITVRSGVFRFGNSSSTDAIAATDFGKDCYVVDDQTVALTSNSSARAKAGVIVAVDTDGVWVAVGINSARTFATQTGSTTLVSGVASVNNVRLTADSRVIVSRITSGGTAGHLSAPSASRSVAGGFFYIASSTTADTSTVDYVVIG